MPAVGNLAEDTAVEQSGESTFVARLNADWEIWGPMGGYVASVALRAVGMATPFGRPASFACSYLGVASFGEVHVEVTPLRLARTAAAHRVDITQDGKPVLAATVWSIGTVDGLTHDWSDMPAVPGPDELRSIPELLAAAGLEPQEPPPGTLDGARRVACGGTQAAGRGSLSSAALSRMISRTASESNLRSSAR